MHSKLQGREKHQIKKQGDAIGMLHYDKRLCLLSHPSTDDDDTGTFVAEASAESTKVLQECYLYYDVCKRHWIRSGKVAGKSSFCKRNYQHSKAARNLTTNQGNFYQKFPDENVDVDGQLGSNQDLRQNYGLAFHPF